MDKKKIKLEKELYKVDGSRVYIESEELANAINQGNLDLFVDEEYNALFINCLAGCGRTDDKGSESTTQVSCHN